jgi:hypothetical protein
MTFTESVNLIDDGIGLVDDDGATVPTLIRPWTGTPSAGRCQPICRMGPTS